MTAVPSQTGFTDSIIVTFGSTVGFTVMVMMLLVTVTGHNASEVIWAVILLLFANVEEIKVLPFCPVTSMPLINHLKEGFVPALE